MEASIWVFITGMVLAILGFLVKYALFDVIILRYVWFQKLVHKKKLTVDKSGLRQIYALLLLSCGGIFIFGGLFGYFGPSDLYIIAITAYIGGIVIGVSLGGYILFTRRYLKFEEKPEK